MYNDCPKGNAFVLVLLSHLLSDRGHAFFAGSLRKADTAGLRAVSRSLYLFATLSTELEGHPRPYFILDAEFYATGAAFEGRDEDTPEEELSFSEPIAETDGVWETHFGIGD